MWTAQMLGQVPTDFNGRVSGGVSPKAAPTDVDGSLLYSGNRARCVIILQPWPPTFLVPLFRGVQISVPHSHIIYRACVASSIRATRSFSGRCRFLSANVA